MPSIKPIYSNILPDPTFGKQPIKASGLEVTPFEVFLDQATEALQTISDLEYKSNDLILKYVDGKVSAEDAVFATNKLNSVMTMATSVVNSLTQTFKEIQQMPV